MDKRQQDIFDKSSENSTTMSSMGRAHSIRQSMGDSTLGSECIEFFRDKYAKVFGKNTPSVAIRVYPFSNENIAEIFKHIDVKGKSVFVVGSSGDQAITAVANGAKEIVLADKNPITQFFTELKIAALSVLSRSDFIKYLCNTNSPDYFSHNYYKKFSHKLPPQSRDFWDALYMDYSGPEMRDTIFHVNDVVIYNIPYLSSDENYKHTQQALQSHNIQYVIDDVLNFHTHMKHKYDLIYLSNIIDYIQGKDNQTFGEEIYMLKTKLNEGGILQYEYSWGPKDYFKNKEALAASEIRTNAIRKYLKNGTIHEITIPSGVRYEHDHKIICYEKGHCNTHPVLKGIDDKTM